VRVDTPTLLAGQDAGQPRPAGVV